MRYLASLLLLCGILSWSASPAHAQCRNGQCSGGGSGGLFISQPFLDQQIVSQPQAKGYEWRKRANDPARWYLHLDGVCIGGYCTTEQVYREYDARADKWTMEPTVPPTGLPGGATLKTPPVKTAQDGSKNFGVDADKLRHEGVFSVSGKVVTRQEAMQAIYGAGDLTDDSNKWHLTVVATDKAKRDAVAADLEGPEFAAVRKDFRIQTFAPDHFAMRPFQLERDTKFQASGFLLFVQPPGGKDGKAPVSTLYEYRGVPALIGALRNIDTNYDPNKNPPLDKSKGSDANSFIWLALGGGLILLAILFMRRPE